MKKTLCILLAALLMWASLPALAVQTGPADQELQRVTLLVKAQLDIPDDFENFYGDSSLENGITTWNLYWSSGDGRSTSITCDGEGRIASYYSYDPDLDSYHYTSDYAPRLPGMELEGFRRRRRRSWSACSAPMKGGASQSRSRPVFRSPTMMRRSRRSAASLAYSNMDSQNSILPGRSDAPGTCNANIRRSEPSGDTSIQRCGDDLVRAPGSCTRADLEAISMPLLRGGGWELSMNG